MPKQKWPYKTYGPDKKSQPNDHMSVKNKKGEILKAGCVLVNKKNQVLLVKEKGHKIWSFPKGHIDPSETFEQAAIREVKEETGFSVEIVKKLPDITYRHGQTGEPIRVMMFLAKSYGASNKSEQELDCKWITKEKAREILYPNLAFLLGLI